MTASRLNVRSRHTARMLAYRNGLVWSIGNGLVGGSLVRYLIQDLAASGTAGSVTSSSHVSSGTGSIPLGVIIALIIAAPHFAGMLRLTTPALIRLVGSRKKFCIGAYLLSCIALAALPLLPLLQPYSSMQTVLWLIALVWCVYHLLEYLATVALWSWLADLVGVRIRGRFIGRREFWMTLGQLIAMLLSGWFIQEMHDHYPDMARWIPYALSAVVGAMAMVGSIVPLLSMPDVITPQRDGTFIERFRRLVAPLGDARYLRLVLFGCWLSMSNGTTQAAQGIFPYTLGFSLFFLLRCRSLMRIGQIAISPTMGRLADRFGNRPVMIACLPVVATGPLFFLAADFGSHWWFVGAWIAWIAWAGINVALPNLMLRLSHGESTSGEQQDDTTAYIASYYAITGACYAMSTLAGGLLFDWFRSAGSAFHLPFTDISLDVMQYNMVLGWGLRTMGVFLLLWTVREDR